MPPAFPASTTLDDFNRADGALAAPWMDDINGSAQPTFSVASNQMQAQVNAWMYYDLGLGTICEVRAKLGAFTEGFAELELVLGAGTAGWEGYTCGTGNGNSYITRYNSGAANDALVEFAGGFTSGDEMGMRILPGGLIQFYSKPAAGSWGLLQEATDPSPPLVGNFKPALFASHATTAFDDFGAVSLADGSSMFHIYRRRRKE